MRFTVSALILLSVAACTETAPDTPSGVGFDDYDGYLSQRERELSGQTSTATNVRPPAGSDPVITDITPAASAPAQPGATPPANTVVVVDTNNPDISDEQDFSAVSARETIESDRERIQAQRENYKVIEPTAVPNRPGSSRPNIVAYALQTTNNVGQPVHRRSGFSSASASARACAKFTSSDQAQEAFLSAGGPQRDRKRLDPDGDGFACGWDPRPFRRAVN